MKHLTTKWNTTIFAEMSVFNSENEATITTLNKDDVITVGYLENEECNDITGRIDGFISNLKKTPVLTSTLSPVNTIKSDIDIIGIILDCSKKYDSNVVKLNSREIVEASGTTDVTKVIITPNIKATITVVSENNGETSEESLDNITVGTEIPTITFKTNDGKKKTISATVVKFMYKEDSEVIKITSIVLKDEEDKIYNVAFKDILSLSEEPPAEEDDSGTITPPEGPSGEDDF